MIKTVYLAGKMTGRLWSDVMNERVHATELLEAAGLTVLDPTRGEGYSDDEVCSGSASPDRCVVERDLADVRRAQATIVQMQVADPGFGTTVEWAYTRFLGKPVFVLIGERSVESLGPWRREMATALFKDVEALVDHLGAFWR